MFIKQAEINGKLEDARNAVAAEISELLFISLGTVNSHCTRVYQKTGCRNAAELIRLILPGEIPGDKIEENN